MTDLIACHRRVLQASVAVVDHVTVADLTRETPCVGWTLADLLAHMIGQNRGFAAAADGTGQDAAVYADRPVGDDPAGDYEASAVRVVDAFARPGLLDGPIFLAEILGGIDLPAPMAIGFHLVDYVAHGWDVARTLGLEATFDDESLLAALDVARAVPDSSRSLEGDTPFRPIVPSTSPALLDQVLTLLGRDPAWAPGS